MKVLSLFSNITEEVSFQKEFFEIGEYSKLTLSDEELAYKLKLRIGGGILLFSPPGTWKTLIARGIARSIEAKFIEISPSIILGYPGKAEKRLENIH